jgi:hypothetical protein
MLHPVPTNEAVMTESQQYNCFISNARNATQNMSVHRIKVAVLPLDLPCSGLLTYSGEILTIGKSQNMKLDGLFPTAAEMKHMRKTVG